MDRLDVVISGSEGVKLGKDGERSDYGRERTGNFSRLASLFAFVLAVAASNPDGTKSAEAEIGHMPSSQYHIVRGRDKTELEKFAQWFHQDWALLYPNFSDGATLYLKNLPSERRKVLRRELMEFVLNNSGRSPGEVRNSWLKLGAQGWQPNLDIIPTLREFASTL